MHMMLRSTLSGPACRSNARDHTPLICLSQGASPSAGFALVASHEIGPVHPPQGTSVVVVMVLIAAAMSHVRKRPSIACDVNIMSAGQLVTACRLVTLHHHLPLQAVK